MRVRPNASRTCAFALALSIAGAIASRGARAADPPDDGAAAAAESLFQEGRRLAEAKRYAEACPKFLASQKLAPAAGTLLNLADCYEKNGQLASAWARFREAMSLAQRMNRADREKTARERAEKLEPRLVRLTVTTRESGVDVTLDGNPLDAAALGTPVPIDPGKHTIEASAKGKRPFVSTIEASEAEKRLSVEIPRLEDETDAPSPRGGPAGPEPASAAAFPQKTVALAVGGVGVVGLGLGAFFGLRTQQLWSDAKARCTASFECDATGVELASDARAAGNVSTVSFVAGAVLVGAGAVLFFTAPKSTPVRVGVGPGSVVVGGAFR